ncbi:MAG: GyrI-like domain-containing protein [Rhodobacteraceae bacterium]|nr:GyrI-like domain-containing protein [Paracoccaceae bacterium]MCB1406678.1 GyrI-like domain-containing protein [Paracoccaceae bacterium]
MDKLDFKKTDRPLYSGKPGRWDRIVVPAIRFLMIDGQGDPNAAGYASALAALYPLAYGVKALLKARGADFTVPPLEALWSAEDPSAFVTGERAAWRWTAMIRLPDGAGAQDVETARAAAAARARRKPGSDPGMFARIRLAVLDEGDCLQTLHVGPFSAEAPVLAALHEREMPELGLTFNGAHHEIYLSDARRTAPDRLRTILRQPVRPL